jgi:hypothetical protein
VDRCSFLFIVEKCSASCALRASCRHQPWGWRAHLSPLGGRRLRHCGAQAQNNLHPNPLRCNSPCCVSQSRGPGRRRHEHSVWHALHRLMRFARVALTWPAPSVKRSVGKPSRQKRWTERLYQAIVRDEHVPPGLTAVVPPWWFGGSLLQPDDPVDLVQAASQELQPEEVLPEAPDPPPLLGNNPLHHKLALAKARAICEC